MWTLSLRRSTFLLLVTITLVTVMTTQVTADRRSVLMNVGGQPPPSLAQASMKVIHGLPRYGGGNSLGVVNPDDPDRVDANKKYALGVALPIAIAFFLAILSWWSCFTFCCARSCCDSCGGRVADKTYNTRDQLWLKIGILILGGSMVVLFGIGIVSNAAVSSSLDSAYLKSDAVIEHLYQFHDPLKLMALVATDALAQVQGLNSTVLTQLPTNTSVDSWIACSNNMFNTMQAEGLLLAQIDLVPGVSTSSSLDLNGLSTDMLDVQATVHSFPNLNTDGDRLVNYSVSVNATLPLPLYPNGVRPAYDMANAQTLFRSAKATGDSITNNLNPAFPTISGPPISNFQSYLQSYDQSASSCQLAEQQSLFNHITANDVSSTTQNEIAHFNTSLMQLPDASSFISALNTFDTQFQNLKTISTSIHASINAYEAAIVGLNQAPTFMNLLTSIAPPKLHSFYNVTSTGLAASLASTGSLMSILSSQLNALNQSISDATLGMASLTYLTGNSSYSGGNSTYNSANATLGDTITYVNSTLPGLTCIKPIFNQLIALNTTVLILPQRVLNVLDRRNQILIQLKRILRIQYDLQTAYSNLTTLHTSLQNFPNLTSLAVAVNTLQAAVNAFPDCTLGSQYLLAIETDMEQLTDSYLNGLSANVPTFNTAVNSASADVANMNNLMNGLQAAINSFPSSWTPFTDYATSISSAKTNLTSSMAQVYAQSTQAGFGTSSGIQDPLKTQFLNGLAAFTVIFQTAPARAALEQSLTDLQTNVTHVQTNEGSIVSSLTNLQNAANALTDTTPVYTALGSTFYNTTSAPLVSLLTGAPHYAMNQSLTAFPDVTSTAASVSATGTLLSSQSAALSAVSSDLQSSTNFISQSDLQSMTDGFNAMRTLVNSFPDLVSPLSQLAIASHGLTTASNSLTSYRHSYYVARQNTVVFKNNIDWLRLLGYMLVLFVPICVAACGLISWLKKLPGFSLYMGMCSFSIMAIFFAMTGVQLIPAILFSDQCVDLDGFLTDNFNVYGLSPSAASPWINLTESTKAGAIFRYFSDCSYPRPELFNQFAQPQQILAANNINFTDYRVRVVNSLNSNNNTISLRQVVWNYFNGLDADTSNIVVASLETDALFDCGASSAVWQPFRESVCSNTGVAGAIALSTCICFVFSICLIPGVCIGIVGYKRFDPDNFGPGEGAIPMKAVNPTNHSPAAPKSNHPVAMVSMPDPFASGLAERQPPMQSNPAIELQSAQPHRASLAAALASTPTMQQPQQQSLSPQPVPVQQPQQQTLAQSHRPSQLAIPQHRNTPPIATPPTGGNLSARRPSNSKGGDAQPPSPSPNPAQRRKQHGQAVITSDKYGVRTPSPNIASPSAPPQ